MSNCLACISVNLDMLRKNDTSPGVKGFWTGGNDIKDEGSWVWTDGSPGN